MRTPLLFLALFLLAGSLQAADTLVWRNRDNSVDADLMDWPLPRVLGKIAKLTGWQVFMEPGASASVSVKFKDVPTDEALRRILGSVSYSLTQSNGVRQLFVYQTEARAATQQVNEEKKSEPKTYLIPNELIVRLKRGSKLSIEELAKLTGAKIISRDDQLGIYRLQFADEASAQKARALLEGNENVAWVDSNYKVDRPTPDKISPAPPGAELTLNPKQTTDCSRIIGLVDTAVQSQPGFENYLMSPISVVGNVTPSSDVPTHGTIMFETMLKQMQDSPAKVLPVVIYPSDPGSGNGSSEQTTTFEVAQGIVKAVNAGANPINLSLGGTGESAFLTQLITDASKKGIVFIAAAGNEPGKTPTYPAAVPGVVAVTAAGPDGKIAPYANSGDFVKAMAPGTTLVAINGQLWESQGTSVATAWVSGLMGGRATRDCTSPGNLTDQIVSSLPVKK